jgi:hypothetical protein
LTNIFSRLLFVLALIFLAGCSEEEKKPTISANLCLTLPNGMVLGPYDTKKECHTARENMPDGKCHICAKKTK